MKYRPNVPGQSLLEYSVATGLVLCLSVGALVFLGDNINNLLGNMLPSRWLTITHQRAGGNLKDKITNSPEKSANYLYSSLVSRQDLLTLTVTVQTSGANGATDHLVNQLQAIIHAQLESNQITNAQASALLELANQGFRLSLLEKVLEDAAHQANQTSNLNNSVVQLDGKQYRVDQVRDMIGYLPSHKTDNLFDTIQARPETLAFINLYH
jgi:hypothetical protein